MKNKIYIKDWLVLKPKNYNGRTDLYYLKIANEIRKTFIPSSNLMLLQFIEEEDINLLCCFLTCYFEDIISQTNIWLTFKSLYKDCYKKTLPFYTLDKEYIEDEINFEDAAFLTWYFLNTIQQDKFINPYNDFILDIATTTIQVLENEYEYAPENIKLKELYDFKNKSEDFYESRAFLQLVFFDSYMFFPDIKLQFENEVFHILEEAKAEDNLEMIDSYIREITEHFTFNKTSSLLSLNAKDWAKALIGKKNVNYKRISGISEKISGLFLYKGQDSNSVFLEHIASSMPFRMTKKSFDYYSNLEEDNILFIGLVKYNDEWWFSGNFSNSEFDADIILDQKNSIEARSKVNFLYNPSEIEDIIKKQEKAFLEFNNGAYVAYMHSNEVKGFSDSFMKHYNKSLDISDGSGLDEALQRAKDDGYFGSDNTLNDLNTEKEPAIVFFNPKNGIEIYFDVLNAFPDKNNPFFEQENNDDIMHLLVSEDYSTEFTYYFLDTFKDKLSFFKKEPYIYYLENIDFLIKFWKKENYHTKSTLVLTGKKE